MLPVTGTCHRCGVEGPLFILEGARYCRPCMELSFRAVRNYRLLERRNPRREPRGFGRRWTDILTEERPKPDS
ncbi:MAG TPA: hypothetical protein VFS34_02730 [Thermoanaerobaculia bacterium]|nr:hypothetical protein [Thermoanaerobaculia bacterium]